MGLSGGQLKTTFQEMSVVEMRMFRWMTGNTLKDWLKKKINIQGKLEITPIEDKMRDLSKMVGHVQRSP